MPSSHELGGGAKLAFGQLVQLKLGLLYLLWSDLAQPSIPFLSLDLQKEGPDTAERMCRPSVGEVEQIQVLHAKYWDQKFAPIYSLLGGQVYGPVCLALFRGVESQVPSSSKSDSCLDPPFCLRDWDMVMTRWSVAMGYLLRSLARNIELPVDGAGIS